MVTIFNVLMFPSHGQLSSTEGGNGFQKEKGKRNSRVLVSHTEASPVVLFTEISLSAGSDKWI